MQKPNKLEIVRGVLGVLEDPRSEVHHAIWDTFPYEVAQRITAQLDNAWNEIRDIFAAYGYYESTNKREMLDS